MLRNRGTYIQINSEQRYEYFVTRVKNMGEVICSEEGKKENNND